MLTYSEEHSRYLKKLKKEKLIITTFRFLIIIIFLLGWELLAKYKIINTFLTTSPSNIFRTIFKLIIDKSLFNHLNITLYEIFISFIISFTISLIISTAMWLYPKMSKIIDPYLTILNSMPKVALGPLIIIWAGSGYKSIIIMGLLISTFVTIINLYTYFINTDKNCILLMQTLRAKKIDILTKVIFPSNKSNIISCIKVNVAMNFIGVIMGELLISKRGLGYLIMYGSSVFHIDLVITSVFILSILSYLIYIIIEFINKKISIS